MDEATRGNLDLWTKWTAVNAASASYDIPGFVAGRNSLHRIELDEVGDVRGKSLLHLQCHFGEDTLSWARLGAEVTGVDFCPDAIALAERLAVECSLPARFVCCDVLDLPDHLEGRFDIVYTSYGVLSWLRDLPAWGRVVAHFLKPGGALHLVEIHPFSLVFEEKESSAPVYPYFGGPEPLIFHNDRSYADPDAEVHTTEYCFPYTLADVVNALIGAGLRLDWLREFPRSTIHHPDTLVADGDGQYQWKEWDGKVPLLFSVKATADSAPKPPYTSP